MLYRLREFFELRSLRHKLMAASIVCILLPAFFTLSIYNYLAQGAVERQAIANSQQSLMLVNGYVVNLLKYMLNIANYVQLNSEMSSYFKLITSGQAEKEDRYQRFTEEKRITELLENFTSVGEKCYVTVLLKDGSHFTNYPVEEFDPLNIEKEPWFGSLQGIQGLQSFWTNAEPTQFASEKTTNPYQVSVVRTLRGEASEVYGYVVVTVMENEINHIFQQLAANQDIMILDNTNHILSHRDPDEIGQLAPNIPSFRENQTTEIVPIQGQKYLVSEMPLPFAEWHLVSLQPYRDAIVNINGIFSKVFVFQALSFVIFLLLLLYLLRHFTRPLIRLGKVADTVQRGNLDVRSEIAGPDEVGRLGRSFDQMLDKVKVMIDEVSLTQSRKRKAELAMLQAQINPHFLFNVLNSIRMKVMRRGDTESAEMIGSLSKLLRMTISREKDEIPLHEEIDLAIDYLNLMNMRQKEKVELQAEVAPEALLIKVPRFCLQPLIENSLIHGLTRGAGIIRIEAGIEGDRLKLSVEDNGRGMDAGELAALRRKLTAGTDSEASGEIPVSGHFSGIGLPNVYDRMRMTYGEGFEMEAWSEPGEGAQILMSIPLREDARDV